MDEHGENGPFIDYLPIFSYISMQIFHSYVPNDPFSTQEVNLRGRQDWPLAGSSDINCGEALG